VSKKKLWVASTLVAICAALAVFHFLNPYPSDLPSRRGVDGTEVTYLKACTNALPWDQPTKIVSTEKRASTLIVEVLANQNCGPVYAVEPIVKRDGADIELGWSWWSRPTDAMAACKCTRHLQFSVPNVDVHDAKISVAKDNR
jgi:hypothetical protein